MGLNIDKQKWIYVRLDECLRHKFVDYLDWIQE